MTPVASTTDFAAMLDATATMARRRSLIIVVSDFIGTGDWDKQLLRLVHRHDVVALRVLDASDDELPDAGLIVVEDAETGEQLIVDSSDPLFRVRYRAGVNERDTVLDRDHAPSERSVAPHRHRPRSGRDPRPGRGEHALAARMSIASPWWLVLGALVSAALIVGAVVAVRRRQRALAAAGVVADTAKSRFALGLWLSIAGVAVLAIAVAGPAASVPVTRAAGTVIIAMDVSNSMSATDVAPSRLDAAKKAATAFVEAQPSSVDIGVVAFQTGGLTTDQPSADHTQAAAAIQRLQIAGGTSLSAAILTSLSAITGKAVVDRQGRHRADARLLGFGDDRLVLRRRRSGQPRRDNGRRPPLRRTPACTSKPSVSAPLTARRSRSTAIAFTPRSTTTPSRLSPRRQRGSYHPASDASELDGIASTINLRLTTHHEDLPLAGAFTAFAIVLLAVGAILTVLRTGRIV